nr:MFS transporter [Gluconobacter cerinus]
MKSSCSSRSANAPRLLTRRAASFRRTRLFSEIRSEPLPRSKVTRKLPVTNATAHTTFRLTPAITGLFAGVCGLTVANIYYAQALIGPSTSALAISSTWAGSIVTLTQLGYGAGLVLIVPLCDQSENRRLILLTIAGLIVSLIGAALSTSVATFMLFSISIGLCSVGSQILLPLATHFVEPGQRGRMTGNIMGGLLSGIMLSRPVANAMAAAFGWRAVFWVSAVVMMLAGLGLARVLPVQAPTRRMSYGSLLRSIIHLLVQYRTLRVRIACHGLVFAVFNMFRTAIPLLLHAQFGFSQSKIALFALAGAGGALAAPLAGRRTDPSGDTERNRTRRRNVSHLGLGRRCRLDYRPRGTCAAAGWWGANQPGHQPARGLQSQRHCARTPECCLYGRCVRLRCARIVLRGRTLQHCRLVELCDRRNAHVPRLPRALCRHEW